MQFYGFAVRITILRDSFVLLFEDYNLKQLLLYVFRGAF